MTRTRQHEAQANELLNLVVAVRMNWSEATDDEERAAFEEQMRGILMAIDALGLTRYVEDFGGYHAAVDACEYIEPCATV